MSHPQSSLECIQDAWIGLLADFRAWCKPETRFAAAWKNRPFHQAVAACKAQLIDDAEGMLTEWRISDKAENVSGGTAAFIPVMLTAIAAIEMPPDVDQMRGIPYWVEATVPSDTQQRPVQIRTIPKAVRAQIAYFCTNPHDAASIADQFCAYMTDDNKRRIDVTYDLGGGVKDQWKMLVIDNNLMPDNVPTDAKNMYIVTVTLTMVGLVPHVIGLGGDWDATTDNGWNVSDGDMGGDNGGQDQNLDKVVIQADFAEANTRVLADYDTGEITTEVIEP
jgi:hypothetical protein